MKDVIISTKGTAKARRNTGMISSIIICLFGIFITAFYCYASTQTHDKTIIMLLLLGLFLLGDGAVMAVIHYINGTTYLDVCPDRIVGKGIQNLNPQDFNIKNEQINNITVQGFWVHIHANGGVYKVMTDKKTASEIFNYYIELKG